MGSVITDAGLTDMLLDILGSRTRRRILELLAEEPRYLLQLSRELGVTMPAIRKHLDVLEDGGLTVSFQQKSDLGAPPRRYYRLNRSLYLTAGITSDFVKIETFPLVIEAPKDVPKEFTDLQREVKNLREIKDHKERLKKLDGILANLDNVMKKLDNFKVLLLNLRQEIKQIANETIKQLSGSGVERRILHVILGSGSPPDPELISARLEIRERTVEDVLKELERKGVALAKKTPVQ